MDIIDKLAWLYIKNKKLLVTRSRGKNVYYIPGGKRKKGESDKQALIREIKEELDIDLIPESLEFVCKLKAQAYGKAKGTILQTTYYSGKFKGKIKPSSEVETISWLSHNDKKGESPMTCLILDWLKEKDLID